jgi:hypothetical protein
LHGCKGVVVVATSSPATAKTTTITTTTTTVSPPPSPTSLSTSNHSPPSTANPTSTPNLTTPNTLSTTSENKSKDTEQTLLSQQPTKPSFVKIEKLPGMKDAESDPCNNSSSKLTSNSQQSTPVSSALTTTATTTISTNNSTPTIKNKTTTQQPQSVVSTFASDRMIREKEERIENTTRNPTHIENESVLSSGKPFTSSSSISTSFIKPFEFKTITYEELKILQSPTSSDIDKLNTILRNGKLRAHFRHFLSERHSVENLDVHLKLHLFFSSHSLSYQFNMCLVYV